MRQISRILILVAISGVGLLLSTRTTSAAVTPIYQSTQVYGGVGYENANDILVTPTHIYSGGIFGTSSVNFNPSGSDVITPTSTSYDAYLSKRTIAGAYQWTKTIGGSGSERISKIATDASGNLYVAGYFGATVDFDPGPGVVTRTSTSTLSGFLLKLDSNGDFQWVKTFSASTASNDVYVNSVVVSGTGVIVTGAFMGTVNFNPDGSDSRTASGGNNDMFLSRWNTDGTYGWTKVVGNNNLSEGSGLYAYNGFVYVTGYFAAPSTPINFNPDGIATSTSTAYDAFISRWSDTGVYGWTRTVRGTGNDNGYATYADASGVYFAGDFTGSNANFNSAGSALFTSAGVESPYLIKFSEAGVYQWGRAWGGSGYDSAWVLTGDAYGVVVGGVYNGSNIDFDPTGSTDLRTAVGGQDMYIACYATDGTYRWVKSIGSSGDDGIYSLGTGGEGYVYMAGYYAGTTNFNPDGSDSRAMQGGIGDAFYSTWRDVYPTTPSGLAAVGATASSVTLNWSAVASSTAYSLFRATSSNGVASLATSTSATTYIDTGLSASTTYYYKILSTLEGVSSATSTEIATTTMQADVAAPIISSLSATAITPYSAVISWTTDEPATTQLTYGVGSSFGTSTLDVALTTNHQVVISNLSSGAIYSVRVYSDDAIGNKASASGLSFTTARESSDTSSRRLGKAKKPQVPAQEVIVTPIAQPLPALFSRNLASGMRGDDVRQLQQTLNRLGFIVALSGPGSEGQETTLFGGGTRAAVIAFQRARLINPAVGYVGVKTRAALNQQ